MSAKDTAPTPVPAPASASQLVVTLALRVAMGVLALLILLALMSYHPDDSQVLAGGIGPYQPVQNWAGRFGAFTAGRLLDWVGFAAYPATLLVLVCALSRTLNPRVKPGGLVYLAGILLFAWGASMFLGIFPNLLRGLQHTLNIAGTPGGAIGERFCAPGGPASQPGWMSFVVNPIGSGIISGAMVVVGLFTVWYFDWQGRGLGWWHGLQRRWQGRRAAAAEADRVRAAAAAAAARVREEEVQRLLTATLSTLEPEPAPEEVLEPPARTTPAPAPAAAPAPAPVPAPAPAHVPAPAPAAAPAPAGAERKPAVVKKAPPVPKPVLYRLPKLDLLAKPESKPTCDPREIEGKKLVLQETLDSFGIDATVGNATCGPRVTLFEIKPAAGVKVERISALANNIAMNLKAESLRILTPIPGKDSVGIEVPNKVAAGVTLRELLESPEWLRGKAEIPICIGRNISGEPVVLDLAKAPHLLIAGATGSGKSVCMNSLIMSLLYRFTPEELKLIMVDPKVVEFRGYNSLPHLVTPVISDVKKVPVALRWALNQMEWRYRVLAKVGARNIETYNARKPDATVVLDDNGIPIPEKLPLLVLIIDELADIMMTAKADVETGLARIAQLARAVGIHAVVATQRPSVTIITGVIKANFPTRIAFQVSSIADSRTILDGKGAESLLGRGDMLYKGPGGSRLERVQGAWASDEDIQHVVDFVSSQGQPEFVGDIFSLPADADAGEGEADEAESPAAAVTAEAASAADEAEDADEALINQAIQVILQDHRATVSHLQRRLRVGYNRASVIMDTLEHRGIVGPQIGQNPREILITEHPAAVGGAAAHER